jgi:protein-S-isoprenylcysteine O-methyltransferase Ste14
MTMREAMLALSLTMFVWLGGAMFVVSLAWCGWNYLVTWGSAAPFNRVAISVDVILLTIFALHHSVFAREATKAIVIRFVPRPLLRSSYVWIASILLMFVCLFWIRIGGTVFAVTGIQVWVHVLFQCAGVWLIARAVATIDPLELAGIKPSSAAGGLQVSGPYSVVRHPLYLGWVMVTFGAASMTGDRLAFAITTTVYLCLAVPWEERSLVRTFGDDYVRYQRSVRWRIVPFIY